MLIFYLYLLYNNLTLLKWGFKSPRQIEVLSLGIPVQQHCACISAKLPWNTNFQPSSSFSVCKISVFKVTLFWNMQNMHNFPQNTCFSLKIHCYLNYFSALLFILWKGFPNNSLCVIKSSWWDWELVRSISREYSKLPLHFVYDPVKRQNLINCFISRKK